MKKSVVLTTTAATIGLATVLTLSAVAPSMAKTSGHSNTTKSASVKSASSNGNQGGVSFRNTQDTRKSTSVNFTISNVPSSITDAATAAKLLVVKVVPLAADATSAPATAPLPTPPAGQTGTGSGTTGAPQFGGPGGHHHGHSDNDGNGGQGGQGGWTPSSANGTTGTTGTTTGTTGSTPSTSAAPTTGTAPTFGNGQGPDNDGDGPGHGHGPKGGFGGPRGMKISNLTLTNGVLTGTIELPGAPVAGTQKFGVYLNIAADSANGIVAQSATPVMVTVTTAADLTPTVTATTGNVTLALTK